jgi:hypothetical protein
MIDLPIDDVCEAYLGGESTRLIGERFGCSGETICRVLHKNGVRMRTRTENMSGDKNPFYGKHHTEETKARMSANALETCQNKGENNPMYGRTGKDAPCYGRCGELHPMFGKHGEEVGFFGHHHTDATKKILSEKHIGIHVGEKSPRWKGGFDRKRPYVLPEARCVKLNSRFLDSAFHHITKSIGIYIPVELHKHLYHSLQDGHGMGEMNMLALQFINGGYDG